MIPILLATTTTPPTCIYGGTVGSAGSLNTGGWIQINMIVILLSFTVAGLIYALSGFLPTSMREKMRGASKYEAFQGMVSILIILLLIAFSSAACQIGQSIVSASGPSAAYQSPMQYSESYIGNLMFSKGLGLFTQIYSESTLIAISANVASTVEDIFTEISINQYLSLSFSPGLMSAMFGFSGALASSFLPLIVVAFGVLFMIYLILPIISSLALTVIVPLAIIMRSIPFAGPKLRESSDTFLALAIGFYFILPLTLIMNGYIISWIYCTGATSICNPYHQFTATYQLASIPISGLFNTKPSQLSSGGPLSALSLPISFFSSGVANQGGLFGVVGQIIAIMFAMPSFIVAYGLKTAEYVFEGVFLIGLDLAITLAFAQGLTKGLNSTGRIIGIGPFWGNV